MLEKHGIHEAKVRSVLTCHARNGVCSKCYGLNLAHPANRLASARLSASSPHSPSANPAPS